MTKSTEQALGEIVRRKSKREAFYHILLREWLRTEYGTLRAFIDDNLGDGIQCSVCGRYTLTHDPNAIAHDSNCLYIRTRSALNADADEIARMVDAWAREQADGEG